MENEERIKALNILFSACAISLFISLILAVLLPWKNSAEAIAIFSPAITYCIGRYLCFKEYKN